MSDLNSLRHRMNEAAERAASLLFEHDLIGQWIEGAIYPSEMAYFLAACEALEIEAVIESGRQDGYSTEILGRWAGCRNVEVTSIDLEEDQVRAARCRHRVRGLPIRLLQGSAYDVFGREVHRQRGRRTAVLVDGPKSWPAISMMCAAIEPHVQVLAIHNLAPNLPERSWFEANGARFYETEIAPAMRGWAELRRREIDHARESRAVRSLDQSSLGITVLDGERRAKLRRASGAVFGLHQPYVVRLLWRLGAFALTPKLYGLSQTLVGR